MIKEIVLPFAPRAWQRPLIEDRSRHIVAVVHRRAGKSTAFIWRGLRKALTEDRRHIPAHRRNLKSDPPRIVHVLPAQVMWQRTGLWDKVALAADKIPGAVAWKSVLRVELPNGGIYQCGGMDKPDSYRGSYADEVIEDEADDVIASGLDMVVEPMLADYDGARVKIGTPKGNGRLAAAYDGAGHDPNCSRYLLPWQATHALDTAQIERLRSTLDAEEFAQELECFPPGSLVATANDVLPIEEIKVGDLVWTHTGRLRPVTATMSKQYAGPLVVIDAYGSRPLRLTPEHPVYVAIPNGQTYQWKAAKDIQPGDWIVTPKKHAGMSIISADLAELIAWFVAEGSVSQNVITFSLGAHEAGYIERVQGCLSRLGREGALRTQSGVTMVTCCDVALADLLISVCGSGAANKRLPLALIAGHEQLVFDTLIDGDGCISPHRGRGHGRTAFLYTTISETLIQQVQLLAASVGKAGRYKVTPAGTAMIEGREVQTRESYCIQMYDASNYDRIDPNVKIRHGRHGVFGKVRSVGSEEYEGAVFNLSVALDESYLVNGRAVHNCSFTAPNSGSYYGRWLDEALRDDRICRVTYDPRLPVYTCWDLGMDDATAIWWFQRSPGGEWRWLEYWEDNRSSLETYAKLIHSKPYAYGRHFLPHDVEVQEMGTGKSRRAVLQGLGVRPIKTVPAANPADRVSAVRMILPRSFFDSKRCEVGLKKLRAYRRQWNEHMGVWRAAPVEDGSQHGADALGYGVQGSTDPEVENNRPRVPAFRSYDAGMGLLG